MVACQPYQYQGILIDPPTPLSDFEFESDDGPPVRLSDFADQLLVVYFGYTYCPDICPTTLYELRRAIRSLGDEAASVQVALVTVDPERDTAAQLDAYLGNMDPSFIGLRQPDRARFDEIQAAFGVFSQREETATAAGYLVSHTSTTFVVIDRQIHLVWSYGTPAEDITADLRHLLRQSSQ